MRRPHRVRLHNVPKVPYGETIRAVSVAVVAAALVLGVAGDAEAEAKAEADAGFRRADVSLASPYADPRSPPARNRAFGDPSDPKARMVPLYHGGLIMLGLCQYSFLTMYLKMS
ncbi:hypothetical protein E2C01_052432 [Portunus trituberculatus]|uniref:Uncharacterized protein n=1 Tax=Portunus trituberculatus TaxID=210409 RepID=A0A5B7GMG1_PORTR|nr:hypothetical protein [Portunus trituberculatus]